MNLDKSLKADFLLGASLVLLIFVSRLTSHIWNFTVVGGVALLAGAYFSKKHLSVLTVFSGMFLSDMVLGFHDQMFAVYFAYAVVIGLGAMLHQNASLLKIFSASLLGASLFFLITNFAVWYSGLMYPLTLDGLVSCYVMGIPFLRAQVTSDLLSALVLFELASRLRLPAAEVKTI